MGEIFINHSIDLLREIIPIFLFAIIASALFDEFLPDDYFDKLFKEVNFFSLFNASFLGALIPICTCGMIPLAVKLYKKIPKDQSGSWQLITAFLVAGNACSIPALWLTTILGYKIMFIRLFASIAFGLLVTYFLARLAPRDFVLELNPDLVNNIDNFGNKETDPCCDHPTEKTQRSAEAKDQALPEKQEKGETAKLRIKKIINDIVIMLKSFLPWILVAILIASFFNTAFNALMNSSLNGNQGTVSNTLMQSLNFLQINTWFGVYITPLIASVIGFPFYFCAGADVPISQELLAIGVPLGTIISFMLASPGVNLTSLLVYKQCVGFGKAVILTVVSIVVAALTGVFINLLSPHF